MDVMPLTIHMECIRQSFFLNNLINSSNKPGSRIILAFGGGGGVGIFLFFVFIVAVTGFEPVTYTL